MIRNPETLPSLDFYFSFRSPYAWLAFNRLSRLKDNLPVSLYYRPILRQPTLDSTTNPHKTSYIIEDVTRFAKSYGLTLRWPEIIDTDWLRPHSAFLYALDQGRPVEFALAAFAARFSQGEDLGQNDTLSTIAEQCGLPVNEVIKSADDSLYQQRLHDITHSSRQQGIFGVPFFVFNDQRFWGNDRIEWLLEEIYLETKPKN